MFYLLHQPILRAAESDPDHEAMRCRGAGLSYGTLATEAHRLAHVLRDRGVRRGDRVGIYAFKSLEVAVAIYGILEAGAAYVPLDPTAPTDRLRRIVRDCDIRVVVTHPRMSNALPALLTGEQPIACCIGAAPEGAGTECLSWETVASASPEPLPHPGTTEQDLAYVLYTSGSTGAPKGIMHTHRSALAFAEIAAATYGLGREDRLSNHAPLHFDLSTLDYFAAAVAGATTVIVPEEYTRLPASLSELVANERMTVLYTVPLALVQLLLHGALERRDLRALRWVLFGGEPFPTKHLRALMEHLPRARFSNVYGPTEVNGCTYFLVPPLPPDSDEPIPIGSLYPNADALVVDANDRVLLPGEVGELLIRSPTRMAGYWGRPEMTDRATYRRRAPGGAEDLFHRTGDLVQERPDGVFLFLGRKDRQIKTRGHRVELDEVEAALLSHDQVEEAATYAVPDGAGSQRIEAAVRLNGGRSDRPADLETHLRVVLPSYALPARIEVMETFPRTTTGKTDRRKLREDAIEAAERETAERGGSSAGT